MFKTKNVPLIGFEPRISGDGSDRSANWAKNKNPTFLIKYDDQFYPPVNFF